MANNVNASSPDIPPTRVTESAYCHRIAEDDMAMTPEGLAAARDFEEGWDDDCLDNAHWVPGPYAWLCDVIDDFDEFSAYMQSKGLTLEEFLKQAVTDYFNGRAA